jgi:hypothetical protein
MRKTASLGLTVILLLSVLGTLAAPVAAAATTYYVNATRGSDANNCRSILRACLTINAAILKASSGDTIIVAAGTYDEQVVIDKSLTLLGYGATAIVKPSSDAKLAQVFDGLFWFGGTKQVAGIIVANVLDGSSVTLKNLKVDESLVAAKPAGADYLAGIFYRETGGLVDTVSVVGGGSWSGTDRAYGMYLSAATNTVWVEVKRSTITNYDKNGIEAHGSKLTASIHHNTITGRGSITDEAQNGVSVGRDAVATVNYNTISNLAYYQPASAVATGILFYHYVTPTGKSATANGNTVTNCQVGIMFKNANALAQDNTVSGGTVGLDGIFAQPNYSGAYTASFVNNIVSGMTKNAAIDAETFATLTPGTGATLTATIRSNRLTGGYTTADGIYVGGSAGSVTATISNNIISGWPEHGINLGDACVAGATITGNTIQNNAGADSGVYVASAVAVTNVHVNFNNIVGNTYGVFNGAAGNLDAKNNWWGCKNGPGASGCDTSSGDVAFKPWVALKIGPRTLIYSDDINTLAVDTGSRQFGLVYSDTLLGYQVCSGVGVIKILSMIMIPRASCVENPSILVSGSWRVSGPASLMLTDRTTGTVLRTFTLPLVWPA